MYTVYKYHLLNMVGLPTYLLCHLRLAFCLLNVRPLLQGFCLLGHTSLPQTKIYCLEGSVLWRILFYQIIQTYLNIELDIVIICVWRLSNTDVCRRNIWVCWKALKAVGINIDIKLIGRCQCTMWPVECH